MGGRPHETAAAVSRASEGETLSAGGERLSSPRCLKFGRPDSRGGDSVLTGAARRPRAAGQAGARRPCLHVTKEGRVQGDILKPRRRTERHRGVWGPPGTRLAPFTLAGEPCRACVRGSSPRWQLQEQPRA